MDNSEFWGLFGVFFFCLCLESFYSWQFLRGLKRDYPRLWKLTGERTIWTDGTLFGAIPTVAYLWKRKYKTYLDRNAVAFCEHYRLRVVGSWFAAGLSLVVFFGALIVNGGRHAG